jgi:hypothetical protein
VGQAQAEVRVNNGDSSQLASAQITGSEAKDLYNALYPKSLDPMKTFNSDEVQISCTKTTNRGWKTLNFAESNYACSLQFHPDSITHSDKGSSELTSSITFHGDTSKRLTQDFGDLVNTNSVYLPDGESSWVDQLKYETSSSSPGFSIDCTVIGEKDADCTISIKNY